MGLLKKLIHGIKSSTGTDGPSGAPAAARAQDQAPDGRKLPNRASRVQLHPLHSAEFKADDPEFGKTVPLANISSSGLGFLKGTENRWPAKDSAIHGTLRLATVSVPVSIKLVHVTQTVVGASFVDPPPELEAQILTYFRLELTARKMIQVNPSALKGVPDGQPHWFYGENNCEVYFVTQGTRIIRFHVTFFANYIEGGENVPAQFGQLEDGERDARTLLKSSSTVQFDPKVADALSRAAVSFLQNVPQLTPEERNQLLALIQRRG